MNPVVRATDSTDLLQASVEQALRPSDTQIGMKRPYTSN